MLFNFDSVYTVSNDVVTGFQINYCVPSLPEDVDILMYNGNTGKWDVVGFVTSASTWTGSHWYDTTVYLSTVSGKYYTYLGDGDFMIHDIRFKTVDLTGDTVSSQIDVAWIQISITTS